MSRLARAAVVLRPGPGNEGLVERHAIAFLRGQGSAMFAAQVNLRPRSRPSFVDGDGDIQMRRSFADLVRREKTASGPRFCVIDIKATRSARAFHKTQVANADEDALVRRFWVMRERHDHWRTIDPRDPQALGEIVRELGASGDNGRLAPALSRILFDFEAIEAEPFAVYDIASDIEAVRARATGRLRRALLGWELASVAVDDARSNVAPVLKRLP